MNRRTGKTHNYGMLFLKTRDPMAPLRTKMSIEMTLIAGKEYGIICPNYDGKYIRSIMNYLTDRGISARYKKLHTKGKGFRGYIISAISIDWTKSKLPEYLWPKQQKNEKATS